MAYNYKADRYITDIFEDFEKSSNGRLLLTGKSIQGSLMIILFQLDSEYYTIKMNESDLDGLKDFLSDSLKDKSVLYEQILLKK